MGKREPLVDRFWRRVVKGEGCWEWQGALNSGGYGWIGDGNRGTIAVHRLSWQLHNDDIPSGLFVCHKCDNPKCVRPDHLFLGTNSDNVRDCVLKGRSNNPKGEKVWHLSKFTPEQVIALRQEFAVKPWPPNALWLMIKRRTWKHL